MNAISLETASGAASAPFTRAQVAQDLGAFPPRSPAAWLPAPPWPGHLQPLELQTRRAAKTNHRAWITVSNVSLGEKCLFAIIAAGAVLAIAYGFSCVVDVVQNWGLFHAGFDRLIQ